MLKIVAWPKLHGMESQPGAPPVIIHSEGFSITIPFRGTLMYGNLRSYVVLLNLMVKNSVISLCLFSFKSIHEDDFAGNMRTKRQCRTNMQALLVRRFIILNNTQTGINPGLWVCHGLKMGIPIFIYTKVCDRNTK